MSWRRRNWSPFLQVPVSIHPSLRLSLSLSHSPLLGLSVSLGHWTPVRSDDSPLQVITVAIARHLTTRHSCCSCHLAEVVLKTYCVDPWDPTLPKVPCLVHLSSALPGLQALAAGAVKSQDPSDLFINPRLPGLPTLALLHHFELYFAKPRRAQQLYESRCGIPFLSPPSRH